MYLSHTEVELVDLCWIKLVRRELGWGEENEEFGSVKVAR
jgi:hypothetical protein